VHSLAFLGAKRICTVIYSKDAMFSIQKGQRIRQRPDLESACLVWPSSLTVAQRRWSSCRRGHWIRDKKIEKCNHCQCRNTEPRLQPLFSYQRTLWTL